MTIQWFPGHMTRARREIEQKLKLIDIVIELLDARIPLASRNPMIDEILQHKPRLVLLNKADLADPAVTAAWVGFFAEQGLSAWPVDASSGDGIQSIAVRARELLADKIAKQMSKGIQQRAIRALIVGIPNVGKSTLINRLAGRNVAKTGDRPGITKGQQWIKAGNHLELLDTPGILWPKFEDQQVGLRLAVTGAIKEEILNIEDVAFYAMRYMLAYYPQNLMERFELDAIPQIDNSGQEAEDQMKAHPEEINLELNEKIVEVMEEIGRKRGCLQGGGRVDLEKASGVILRELRSGKLGRVTLERPE